MYVLHRPVPSHLLTSPIFSDGLDKGIIPLTCSELFVRVEQKKANDPNINFSVEVSYIEVWSHPFFRYSVPQYDDYRYTTKKCATS